MDEIKDDPAQVTAYFESLTMFDDNALVVNGAKKIYIHENYGLNGDSSDVALIELSTAITTIAPIKLQQAAYLNSDDFSALGRDARIMGFGE